MIELAKAMAMAITTVITMGIDLEGIGNSTGNKVSRQRLSELRSAASGKHSHLLSLPHAVKDEQNISEREKE